MRTASSRHARRVRAATALAAISIATITGAGVPATVAATTPGDVSGELRVVSNWTGAEGDAFQAVIDAFGEQFPDVTVTIEQVPFGETQALLTQQFAAGDPPDVSVALPGIIRLLSDQDLLLDIGDLWDDWIAAGEYTDALRAIASAPDGATYGVYFKGNVNGLIWYTPAQLEELGLAVPTTWDEFIAALDAAEEAGIAPLAVGGADGWPLTQWSDPIILRVAGAEAFNALARGEIGWDDPAIVESFEVYADIATTYFPDDVLGTGFIDATCARAGGDALFQNQGAFINLITPAECDESLVPGEDFTFFPMPAYRDEEATPQAVSGDLFIGARDTDNPDATLALLAYLGSAEAQQIWAERGGYIAPNATVPVDVYPDVNDQAAAELWPRDPATAAGYDLDDWIGGEIQSRYVDALESLVRDGDVDAFIATMTAVDTRSQG
jgi:ABC-type glycerol-3-phosphate transport system substrate-binding protein